MAIRILSDSACDMDKATREALGVEMIPLTVSFGDKEFKDGIDLSHDEFFEKLIETDTIPTTSQISPFVFENIFKSILSGGDDIVYISISSKFSGCYQNALMAAESFPRDRIFIVDSLNASLGQYILVKYACELRDKGLSPKEITEILEEKKHKIKLLALIDTLLYLQKGGRLSKSAYLVGNLISIKPVITVKDGEVVVLGKARGSKKGNNLLTEIAKVSGGFDYKLPMVFAYSGLSSHLLDKYMADNRHLVENKMDVDAVPIITIGAAIGTHVGPGAIGIAFFSRE